jgi:hypothetical protein
MMAMLRIDSVMSSHFGFWFADAPRRRPHWMPQMFSTMSF